MTNWKNLIENLFPGAMNIKKLQDGSISFEKRTDAGEITIDFTSKVLEEIDKYFGKGTTYRFGSRSNGELGVGIEPRKEYGPLVCPAARVGRKKAPTAIARVTIILGKKSNEA